MSIEEARVLLRSNDESDHTRGLEILKGLSELSPENSDLLFEYAGGFDFLGQSEKAAELYEQITLDRLFPGRRPEFYIQYGSTLRCLKRFEDSRRILQEGAKKYAGYPAIWAFLALTEYSCGEPEQAIQTLIKVLIEHPSHGGLSDFSRALTWYAENLKSFP